MASKSGREGDATLTIGATVHSFPVVRWGYQRTANTEEFRNSKTQGGTDVDATFVGAITGTIELDFDDENNPFDADTEITSGDRIDTLKLYVDRPANRGKQITDAVIVGDPIEVPVDGKIALRLDFKAASFKVTNLVPTP